MGVKKNCREFINIDWHNNDDALFNFSTYITPLALNKSRQLLNTEQCNSFLPTIKQQQFSDSFKGFTMIVEEKK